MRTQDEGRNVVPASKETPATQVESAKRNATIASPAERREAARRAAGYDSLKVPAQKLRLSERYLRQIELHGRAPYHTAMRLSRFYGCPLLLWI